MELVPGDDFGNRIHPTMADPDWGYTLIFYLDENGNTPPNGLAYGIVANYIEIDEITAAMQPLTIMWKPNQLDYDADGIKNGLDDCPTWGGDYGVGNGCPPGHDASGDIDEDTIINGEDLCPQQAGTETNLGCPNFGCSEELNELCKSIDWASIKPSDYMKLIGKMFPAGPSALATDEDGEVILPERTVHWHKEVHRALSKLCSGIGKACTAAASN